MLNKILKFWVGIILATSLFGCQVGVAGPGAAGVSTTYTVQAGDCLTCIAARYSVTTPALIDANKGQYPSIAVPSSSNRLQVGWVLVIPAGGHIVKPAVAAPVSSVSSAVESDPPVQAATPTPGPTADASGGYFDDEAALEIVRLTNAERVQAGLNELAVDEGLMGIARQRAVEIVTDFSHAGLTDDCAQCGENICNSYLGAASAAHFVSGWMASEGHRANILWAGVARIGVAVYRVNGRTYATQEFAY